MQSLIDITRRADITFYKTGKIEISARIASILDIHAGDVINIYRDAGEYYLVVTKRKENIVGRYLAQCYPSNKRGRNFRANSKRLCDIVLGENGNVDVCGLPCGEPQRDNFYGTILPLIIKNNLRKNDKRDSA